MTHGADKREEFLKALETTPFIGTAARKVDVTRMTIYRWMHDDPEFKRAAETVRRVSREAVSEKAESNIIKGINNGDKADSKFFLTHNSKFYSPKLRGEEEKIPLMDKFDDYEEFGPDYQMEIDLKKLRRMFTGPDGKLLVREASLKKFLDEVERQRKQDLIEAFSDENGQIVISKKTLERLNEKYGNEFKDPTDPTDQDTSPPDPETSA